MLLQDGGVAEGKRSALLLVDLTSTHTHTSRCHRLLNEADSGDGGGSATTLFPEVIKCPAQR